MEREREIDVNDNEVLHKDLYILARRFVDLAKRVGGRNGVRSNKH